MKKTLGQKIKNLRQKCKLSIFQLHKALGVSTMTISKWENNKSKPTTLNLINVAKFFNVSLDYLLGLEE